MPEAKLLMKALVAGAGVPQAKQKSHKKKKREIDKSATPGVTPSGIMI